MQLFKGTITIPSSGTTVRTIISPNNLPIRANVSINPTSNTTTFTAFPYTDNFDCPAGSASVFPDVELTGFTLTGTVGDTVSVAIYFPEVIRAPPVAVTATIPNTVKTDFGQSTAPASIVAATGTSAATVMSISGTPMIVASIQDPPQETDSRPGKSLPVKTNA